MCVCVCEHGHPCTALLLEFQGGLLMKTNVYLIMSYNNNTVIILRIFMRPISCEPKALANTQIIDGLMDTRNKCTQPDTWRLYHMILVSN